MLIQRNDESCLNDFIRLNELWISEYFSIEAVDKKLAADPGAVIRKGGHIFSAHEDERVIGVVALFSSANTASGAAKDEFELARMAVSPDARRRGVGRALATAALSFAQEVGVRRVFLLSNTCLSPAIALYQSLGFTTLSQCPHPDYARCNIVMERVF